MKTPLLNTDQRAIIRLFPETFTASRLKMYLAKTELKRNLGRELEPILGSILDRFIPKNRPK